MLSKDEESKFVDDLCQKLKTLESEALKNVDRERSLTDYLYNVINDWKNTTLYKDNVQVWNKAEKFNAFNRQWGPDISIQTKEKPSFIAVELKLGKKDRKGWALKSGIGQAIIYSNIYDYTIFFCLLKVGCVPEKHEYDARIESALWDKHKIKIIILYKPS